MLGTKLNSQLLVFSESAYLSPRHIFTQCTIYTREISDIFEQNNGNYNL